MVVSPNKKEYNSMIRQLTSPLETWMGKDKYHKGYHDFNFDNPIGQKFVPNSYCYPEQNYLTKRYSGKWTFIEFAFQSWSLDPSIHSVSIWQHSIQNLGSSNLQNRS